MNQLVKKSGNFLKRLHRDESAPNTVEWVLLVIVALIVMIAIYFIAKWVLSGGAEEAAQVDTGKKTAEEELDNFKNLGGK